MKTAHPRTPAFAVALALLSACGGGDNRYPLPPQTTVSGTVASDVPLAGYGITVLAPPDPSSTNVLAAGGASGADGRYSVTGSLGSGRPLVVHASADFSSNSLPQGASQYPRLFSVSHGTTANITPLTTLLVTRLLNRKLGFFADASTTLELQDRPQADISAARDQVAAYLLNRPSKDDGNITSPVDVSAVTDFVSTPLTTMSGDPHFEALKRLHDSMMDSETIQGVEEHMLFGNDAPADLRSVLALDFMADCTPFVNNVTVPSGPTRIILAPRGITFGNIDVPFQTGGQLQIDVIPSVDDRWLFSFGDANQSSVTLTIGGGRLKSIGYFNGLVANSSGCVPQAPLSLSGKYPSLTALVGVLRQSVALPREFQCSLAITVPGFLPAPTPNTLILDPNGALRVNTAGGPSLHLLSQTTFSIVSPLVVASGQLSPIRPTNFSTSGPTGNSLMIQLTAAGQITLLRLNRNVGTPSGQSQTCQ